MHPMTRRATAFVAFTSLVLSVPAVAHAAPGTSPTIVVAASRALTSATSASFSEAVGPVTSDNVVLRVAGTTANMSATQTCYDAVNAAVACGGATVRRVSLQPAAPLLAGQVYALLVNPSGSTPLLDTDDMTPVPAYTESFRASSIEQESSVGARYHWRNANDRAARGGSYKLERRGGATATFAFNGTRALWYTRTGPDMGEAQMYVDGSLVHVFNLYSRGRHGVSRATPALAAGPHVLTIRVRGVNGHSGGNSWVVVDAVRGGSTMLDDGTGRYEWHALRASSASGDRYARADTPGASVDFWFRSTGIDWYTVLGPDQGIARVRIDGKMVRDFDNYSPSVQYGVRRTISRLSDGVHRITILALGQHRRGARGSIVAVDRWGLKAPTTAFRGLGVWVDLFDFGPSVSGGLQPSSAIPAMRDHGVKTIYIETGRSTSKTAFGDQNRDYRAALAQWIETAHSYGIRVIGWYLPYYSENVSTDISRTSAIATFRTPRGQAFDALAIDIETCACNRNTSSGVHEFNAGVAKVLSGVRSRVGTTFPVGAITFVPLDMDIAPARWAGFPWSSVARYSDVVVPMNYYTNRTKNCDKGQSRYCPYNYTAQNVARLRALTKLPVHLIGGGGCCTTLTELKQFVKAAKDTNSYGCSIYDYRTTRSWAWSPLQDCRAL
jgi:hypothetical protein